jgi:hypothetical protein
MNILIALVIGALMGGLNGVGIFFEPREPYKIEILLAATLKGVLISLLTGFSLGPGSSWLRGAGFGMLYGFAFGLVIFLAKGAFKSKDAPYVVPMSLVHRPHHRGVVGEICLLTCEARVDAADMTSNESLLAFAAQ